jgi:hypothetical protein
LYPARSGSVLASHARVTVAPWATNGDRSKATAKRAETDTFPNSTPPIRDKYVFLDFI